MNVIDLTHLFTNSMPVFPGDDLPKLQDSFDAENVIVHYHLETGMHIGTHMDGPLHMVPGAKKLSDIKPENFIAPGVIIDARGKSEIGVELLAGKIINPGDCIIIYTGFASKFNDPEFYTNYPDLTEDFARKLVDLKVKFVGMDTCSPDKAPYKVHRILLKAEILIIESLTNLDQLLGLKSFEIIALPAKFEAEAAPVRVIARY